MFPTMRRNHFPVRRNHFLMRRSHFPVRRNHFPMRRNRFPVRRSHFLMRRNRFLMRRNCFPIRRRHFLMRRNDFPMRRRSWQDRISMCLIPNCFFLCGSLCSLWLNRRKTSQNRPVLQQVPVSKFGLQIKRGSRFGFTLWFQNTAAAFE